jgi:hypothetical protein
MAGLDPATHDFADASKKRRGSLAFTGLDTSVSVNGTQH